ncbi:MAG: hypothetical protein QM749_16380 [Aquabacterium sp.]
MMVRTKCIPDGTKIWYDVRPNSLPDARIPHLRRVHQGGRGGVHRRDLPGHHLQVWKLRRDNMTFRVYPTALIDENKWRAVRYGLDGKLLDFGKQEELPARELIHEMIDWFLHDVIDELGTRKEVEYAYKIMEVAAAPTGS